MQTTTQTPAERAQAESERIVAEAEALKADHDCDEHAQYVTWDGPIGHGWACGVCGEILQVG